MADVETPTAAPSPAAEPSTPAEKPAPVSVPKDSSDYAAWRMTGVLPDQKEKASKDDSPPFKTSADDESGKGAPASEAGSQPRQKRGNADTRKEELNREIRELLARRDALKQEEGKKDVKAEPSPAPPTDERPVKPKQADFRTWEEFETAQEKYVEDLAEWTAGKRIREHLAQEQQKAATREMQERLNEAKSRYGDEAESKIIETARTVFEDKAIPPAIKAALGRSQVITDALYVMGSDAAEFDSFVKLAKEDPLEALRKWYTVEALVQEELAKQAKSSDDEGPPRGPNGQFQADKPPPLPRKVSMAPAPAAELNARSSPPVDEVQRSGTAASKGTDPQAVRRYFEAKNREQLAKRRTG